MKRALILGILLAGVAAADESDTVYVQLLDRAAERLATGDFDGAERSLRLAAEEPEADAEPWVRLGNMFESQNQLDNAIEAYGTAAQHAAGPQKGEVLGRRSLLQELRGMSEANQSAEAAAAADPEGMWPLIALSRARSRAGKGAEAVALAEKAAAAGGGSKAVVALGFAQEASGDLAAAEQTYSGARASDQADIAAGVGLARVLRKAGRAAEAEPLLLQVLEIAPGAIDAYKESARTLIALNRVDEAMGQAQTASILAENDLEAKALIEEITIARAVGYVARNQASLAVQDLTALRDASPDSAAIRVGLATALMALRQVDEAVVELRKAIELDPGIAQAHYDLGRALHMHKRDAAGALPAYEKAVELDPANLEYRTNLGAVLSETQQPERAVEELQIVVDSPGYDRPEAWIYLGGANLGAKRYKEGVEALQRALTLLPDSPHANAYAAWCYFGLKDAEGFKKHGRKAVDLGYQDPNLQSYLERVEGGEEIK